MALIHELLPKSMPKRIKFLTLLWLWFFSFFAGKQTRAQAGQDTLDMTTGSRPKGIVLPWRSWNTLEALLQRFNIKVCTSKGRMVRKVFKTALKNLFKEKAFHA